MLCLPSFGWIVLAYVIRTSGLPWQLKRVNNAQRLIGAHYIQLLFRFYGARKQDYQSLDETVRQLIPMDDWIAYHFSASCCVAHGTIT
ncbi:MAG: hypothetical protein IPL70_19025 [Uliginosibacterium sp.]|nr:hypothetical protein [Uliginosibacterium sp.]